ncbi:MAG: sigma-70 family RNA polymerase sigma factor [Mycobacterium sp.]
MPSVNFAAAIQLEQRDWMLDTIGVRTALGRGWPLLDDMERSLLLTRARDGDPAAFAELVSSSRGVVWAVCLRITGNTHDAEDALQDTLASAWKNMHRFRGNSSFSTWLFRIATNAALAVVRRRVPCEEERDGPADSRDIGDRVADANRVQDALMRLPESFRAALVLRTYGDFTYEDIAIHQRIPVQTVKSRISRARRMTENLLTT